MQIQNPTEVSHFKTRRFLTCSKRIETRKLKIFEKQIPKAHCRCKLRRLSKISQKCSNNRFIRSFIISDGEVSYVLRISRYSNLFRSWPRRSLKIHCRFSTSKTSMTKSKKATHAKTPTGRVQNQHAQLQCRRRMARVL